MKLQIFVESFRGAVGCNHLVALQSGLAHQVDAFPIIGVGLGGISGNGFVEGGDGIVNFAGVGHDGAFVEVIGSGAGRIGLGGLVVGFDGIIRFARFRQRVPEVVVVAGDGLRRVGIFLSSHICLL